MVEFFTSTLILLVFITYLSLSLFIFRDLGIMLVLIITGLFYFYTLLATIIIVEIIGPITNLI